MKNISFRIVLSLLITLMVGIGVSAQQVTVTVQESAGGCDLVTDCDNNIICVDIVMSVDIAKTLDSYNIWVEYDGTVISREAFGVNNNTPVGDNSCVIANGSQDTDLEGAAFNPDHWRVSGVPGMGFPMVANTPYIVHTICFIIQQPTMLNGQQICVGGNVSSLLTTVTFTDASSDTDVPETCMTLGSNFASCTLLPIEFLDFSAKKSEGISLLDWTTSYEMNSDFFEVQRAGDNKEFSTIGKVKSTGNTSTVSAYRFKDEAPLDGKNFYRIKQVDFDGRFMYSPVRSLLFNDEAFAFRVWPNPVSSFLYIRLQNFQADEGEIKLINAGGQVVLSQSFKSDLLDAKLDISSFQPGLYSLVVETANDTHMERITIVK